MIILTLDLKKLSLTNISGRFSKNDKTYTLGDVFEYFSQYALSTNLKGVSYDYSNKDKRFPKYKIVIGYTYLM